jgi:hypothetical protein
MAGRYWEFLRIIKDRGAVLGPRPEIALTNNVRYNSPLLFVGRVAERDLDASIRVDWERPFSYIRPTRYIVNCFPELEAALSSIPEIADRLSVGQCSLREVVQPPTATPNRKG